MPPLSNQNQFQSIYNSTISRQEPKYGEEFDYFWTPDGQEVSDSTFQGVKGRVGLANERGRQEGDDLVAPHHWD